MRRKDSVEVKRILVGVAGASASGKSTLCNNIRKEIQYDEQFGVLVFGMDNYYKTIDFTKYDVKDYNFDHPDALDFDMMYENIVSILEGKNTMIPMYDFKTHQRTKTQLEIIPQDVILFEGIFALYDERIRNLMQYKIFMHCDDDIRLCRRLIRDVSERGRQYNRFVKRSFDEYIKSTMNFADLIVPGNSKNSVFFKLDYDFQVAVSFIVQHLKSKAFNIGLYKQLVKKDLIFSYDVLSSFENLLELEQKYQKKTTESESSQIINEGNHRKIIIFPNSEEMKRDLSNSFMQITERFSDKRLWSTLKEYSKSAFKLFVKVCTLEEIQFNQCSILDLKTFVQGFDTIDFTKKQKYLLVCIPVYLPQFEQQFLSTLEKLEKQEPSKKVIVILHFSSVGQITKIKESCSKIIECIINCMCIGNRELFVKNLLDQFDNASQENIQDPFIKSDKIVERFQKSLTKKQKEKND